MWVTNAEALAPHGWEAEKSRACEVATARVSARVKAQDCSEEIRSLFAQVVDAGQLEDAVDLAGLEWYLGAPRDGVLLSLFKELFHPHGVAQALSLPLQLSLHELRLLAMQKW